ncbi:PREDICTED: protein SMAX1-LIKE 4-like isoform X1 [Ipomoea nil]|uniref:protein SMAX1-LIKE 4-like isoform X1 n=1 Tax=Ipomoea nil TaxID=35883 RepID=UPI0009016700|nr:PREDICTED: protein SMAX1-LIKE 4-like isoform X1 [Ipomoea nil]
MRTGACAAVQQTLTTEAASVLKHSLSLARRRGHAQITPLHVAATLLSSRFSLLKRACLKSQPSSIVNSSSSSHPLQCRALELCFNVALNRLPASPAPLLHGQPSLSNALVAALKRAQAHQRRGCIEQQQQQQQPHWVIKVEVEQLVLSILDDPSVSRVMREAGFSSTAVKATLEELSSTVSSVFQAYNSSGGGIYSTPSSPPTTQVYKLPEDDVNVVNVLLGGARRNVVIVADSAAATHGVFNDLMGKVERGQVPEELKSAHFIKFQFSAAPLALMRREEVETNMAELKRKVESLAGGGRGVIIYTGDLKWTVDNTAAASTCAYNPVDHLVAEIGRLLSSCTKVWLVGTANFQTYIKCQMRQPPLDLLWALQPVSVPSGAGALSLTLNATTSFQDLKMAIVPQNQSNKKEEEVVLTCCPECTSNYAREAAGLVNQKSFETKGGSDKPLAHLPDWLIPHAPPHQKDECGELRRKWNRICESLLHQTRNSPVICKQGKGLLYTTTGSIYPPGWANDENSVSLLCDSPVVKSNLGASCVPRFRRQQSCHIEFSFSNSKNNNNHQPNLDSLRSEGEEDKEVLKISLALGNSPIPEQDLVSNELHENLPWQSQDSLSAIRETLMGIQNSGKKQEWVLIRGNDMAGKRRLARVIAHSILPSSHLLCLNMRRRKGVSVESLEMGIRNHPRIVVLVESVDLADPHLLKFLANTLHNGIPSPSCSQAVFVLTINDDYQFNRDNDEDYTIPMKLLINETPNNKDLKRRAQWGDNLQINKRINLEAKTLDLNIKAEDDDDDEETQDSSSDLTRDSSVNDPLGFLETIKNQVVLNSDSSKQQKAKDMLSSKIKQSLEQVLGGDKNSSWVDENVIEELLQGCGGFLNSLFEKWLKDVLQTSLQYMVDHRKEEGVSNVRLCLGEEKGGDTFFQDGFMGTCLPKRLCMD